MSDSSISGDVVEEHGDYRFEIHARDGRARCLKTPLNSGPDNAQDIPVRELPDVMLQQYGHLLPRLTVV